MAVIYLIRHGQDVDNARDILNGRRNQPLTHLGRMQAHQVANKLKNLKIDAIYSSPLKRAYETALIIAKTLNINKVIKDRHLIERNFGVLTGKPRVDIPNYSKKLLKGDRVTYFLKAEGAETFPQLLKRAKTVLREINDKHSNKNIIIVTHGDTGKMIRAAFHNWPWLRGLKTPYFGNTEILELKKKRDVILKR